jgi:hypothetical protein
MFKAKKVGFLIVVILFLSITVTVGSVTDAGRLNSSNLIFESNSNSNQDNKLFIEKNVQSYRNKNYSAVLVGINDYPGVELDLPYSVNEINSFKDTLLQGLNWDESNIYTSTDSDATANEIIQGIRWLDSQEGENDISIFYYAGHGGQTPTNEYLITYNSTLSDTELAEEIDELEGKVVVILDCCYSGGFIEELRKNGRVIITSCDKNGIAFQHSELKSGIFGYFFNLSLQKLTKAVELSFLFSYPMIHFYIRRISEEMGRNISMRPKISDRTLSPVKIIYRGFFTSIFDEILGLFSQYEINHTYTGKLSKL